MNREDMMEPIEGLEPHPENRKFTDESLATLVASIQANGVLEPIQYRVLKRGKKQIRQILHGHRRARAAELAGETEAPMLQVGANDQEALTTVLVANLERENLDVVDEAELIRALAALDAEPERIAAMVARDLKWVQGHLCIAVQPEPVKKALREKRMSPATIFEAANVAEAHRKVAEQTLLSLASGSGAVNEAYASAQLRRDIEQAEQAAAWETGKAARVEAFKDMLTAHKWKGIKLLHRKFDEPLDGDYEWAGIGETLPYALADLGIEEEAIRPEHREKRVGDMVAALGGVSALIVPKKGWHRDDEEYCTTDAVARVNVNKLDDINRALPSEEQWYAPVEPVIQEDDEDPDPVDWKERQRIEREKRENRKSEVEEVMKGMGIAVKVAAKDVLVREFRSAYHEDMMEDAMSRLDQYAELMFPDKTSGDATAALEEWVKGAPITRHEISLVESLGRMFDDIESLVFYPERADKLAAVFEKFPAGPELDRAIALVEKIKAGEL